MKTNTLRKLAFGIFFVISSTVYFSQSKTASDTGETCELSSIISQINATLNRANKQLALGAYELSEAEINLEVISTKTGGGGIKIFVKASKKWEAENSSSITFTYKKPPQQKMNEIAATQVADQLYTAILDASRMFTSAGSIDGLIKDSFKVEIAFAINKTVGGGVEFEVWGIGVDVSGDWSKKVAHTITLEFHLK